MKKILYIANARIPTEKAHGLQIMKMCEAFSKAGHDVELVVPRRFNNIKDSPFAYYGVKENFKIKKVFSLDLVFLGKIGFLIESLSFAIFSAIYSYSNKSDLVYGRDEISLFFISGFRKNIIFEAHTPQYNFFARKLVHKNIKIACISQGLKDFYINKGVNEENLFVAPDAVSLKEFTTDIPGREKCREILNLPKDKFVVMYTGHLYDWKGADILAKAAEFFAEDGDVEFIFVGGTDKDIKRFKKEHKRKNITIQGRVPRENIPFYLSSADILALPNSAKSDISRLYTSPMKLFEYMTSRRPIVSSDLPSIREILTDESTEFVEADNGKALAEGIERLLENKERSNSIANRAFERVNRYTWDNRVKEILGFWNNN